MDVDWDPPLVYLLSLQLLMSHMGLLPDTCNCGLQMPGTFSLPPRVTDPGMHHGTCVAHVPWCMPGSLASGFLWSRWRGKRSRHSRRVRKPQFAYLTRGPWYIESKCDLQPPKYRIIIVNKFNSIHNNVIKSRSVIPLDLNIMLGPYRFNI